MRNPKWMFLLVFVGLGCGSSPSDASCEEVCARLMSLCGVSSGSCTAACEASLSTTARRCVVDAPSCAAADACGRRQTADAGGTQATDAGTAPACDGTKYCADANTAAVCVNDVTRKTPCNGKRCAAGRCGACSSDADCRSVSYRCKCKDGTERTGAVDSVCGDSQGTQRWCSHPSIGSSICAANGGGFDETFGYLGSGCVSGVDP